MERIVLIKDVGWRVMSSENHTETISKIYGILYKEFVIFDNKSGRTMVSKYLITQTYAFEHLIRFGLNTDEASNLLHIDLP